MIRVHVWEKTVMGHASMHVGSSDYISWWPEANMREPKLPGSAGRNLPLYSVRHVQGQSFDDDKRLEGDNGRPLAPHHTVIIDGLDEIRILSWWRKYNVATRRWSTLGQNCATTVGRGLMVGGADDYALGTQGWWQSWNTVWTPDDVLRYAQEVRRGLAAKRGQQPAINFVRRFCQSPLGFTSMTLKMDEKRLAQAIYDELGSNGKLIHAVFQELDERRNTDADDVAEIYVRLLWRKKGPPLAAVAKNSQLKNLLIRLLDEGWTSAGEQKCIVFLKSLN